MTITEPLPAGAPWLTILVALPTLAALVVGFVPAARRNGRVIALGVSLMELVLAIVAATSFDWSKAGTYQLLESHSWIPQIGVTWALSVNALGLVMVLLAVALVPLVLLAGWKEDEDASQAGAYSALVLSLEAFMVLIFAAFDIVVFYIAFEAMLVPLYFMIGRFGVGDPEARRRAALKFLLYSLAGGLAMLGGLVAMWAHAPADQAWTAFRLDVAASYTTGFSSALQMGVFVSFMIAFAIKAPMVPVHTWLPDTAAVARPGTSVLLVGVLDKIGTFGMIVFCLRLFPDAAQSAKWVLVALAVLSIMWGGLAAIGQDDIMRLVSYTSVSHFGFMVLGIFIGSSIALTGTMFYMVAHGISIAAMFLISGFLTQRGKSRSIASYGGWQRVTPLIAGTWLTAGLASVALPGLSGFVPEYLVLMGTWKVSVLAAAFAIFGVIIAALYLLWPYQKIFTGPVPGSAGVSDMDAREKTVVTPLIAAMAVLGIWSAPLIGALTPVAEDAVQAVATAQSQTSVAPTASALAGADEGSTK